MKALEKEPGDRFQSARDMDLALAACADVDVRSSQPLPRPDAATRMKTG